MSFLLILCAIILYSFQTLFCKMYTDQYPGRKSLASPVFCVCEGIAIALFTLLACKFKFEASPVTILIGVVNACVLLGYNTSLIKAGERGSYAFMNVMMLFGGILLPMFYSIVFLGDSLSLMQIAAIVIMLGSFVLMNLKEIKLKGAPVSYYVLCLLLFLFNGIYSVLLKVQSVYNDDQSKEMVIITFGVMGLISLVQLIFKEKKDTPAAFRLDDKSIVLMALCIISATLAINVVVLIMPYVNLSVFYTLNNGGVLLLSAAYSVVLFKEKLSVPKVIGILMAIASVTMLSI